MEDFSQIIRKDFEDNYSRLAPYYKKAIINFLLIKNEKKSWLSNFGKILMLNQPLKKNKSLRYDYGDLILLQEEKEPPEVLSFIKKIFDNIPIELDGKSISFKASPSHSHFTPSFMSDGVFQLDWPHIDYDFTLNFEQNITRPTQKLVAKDAPFFPDIDHAIKYFFAFPNLRFDSNSKIRVILPDYRGRIKELRIKDNEVAFQNETKCPSFNKFSLRLYYAITNGPIYSEISYDIKDNGTVTIPTKKYPQEIEAVLTLDGIIVDSLQFYPLSYWARTKGIIIENSTKRIEEIISEGENFHTEFKLRLGKEELTDDSKKDKIKQDKVQKRDEFLESVVAFANAEGGTIYIGVSDQGQIVGLEDPKGDEQRVIEHIDKFCKSPVQVSTEIVEIHEKNILSVTVPSGMEKPYFMMNANLDEFAYIRRGATDRKIKSNELQDLFFKKLQSTFPSDER